MMVPDPERKIIEAYAVAWPIIKMAMRVTFSHRRRLTRFTRISMTTHTVQAADATLEVLMK